MWLIHYAFPHDLQYLHKMIVIFNKNYFTIIRTISHIEIIIYMGNSILDVFGFAHSMVPWPIREIDQTLQKFYQLCCAKPSAFQNP